MANEHEQAAPPPPGPPPDWQPPPYCPGASPPQCPLCGSWEYHWADAGDRRAMTCDEYRNWIRNGCRDPREAQT